MALDFPANPTNGQYYNGFVYNAANSSWDSAYAPRAATIPISSPNYIINGNMDVWQRGTNGTIGASVGFAADRWQSVTYAGGTMYWNQVPAGTNPTGAKYALRIQRAAGATNTASMNIAYSFETQDVLRFAGKTVTWSFYARAGATYSPVGSTLSYAVIWGTGTDQSIFGTGISGGGDIVRSTVTLTTSWQRYTITVAVPANATSFGVNLYSGVTGTAGASDYYEFIGAQLEEGAAATDFRRNQPNIQAELAACQRYYWEARRGDVQGISTSDRAVGIWVNFPVTMRTTPTVTFSSGTFPYWAIDNEGAFGWGGMSIKTTTAKSVMWDAGIWPTINDYYPVSILGGFVTYISAEL